MYFSDIIREVAVNYNLCYLHLMDDNQTQQEEGLSKYELKKQKKEQEKKQREQNNNKKSALKPLGIVFASVVLLGGGGWWILSQEPAPESDSEIIAKNGIHWHPELSIVIKGEKSEIPANIGLGITHSSVHTHDPDGVIHLEFSGMVRTDDIRLGRFFKEWDKTFTSGCIFEFCDGEEEAVKMLVNGEENHDFENYIMRDGDKIEIMYEAIKLEASDGDENKESDSEPN